MTFPENFAQKIGFDKIITLLQAECITASASDLCGRIGPVHPFEKLKTYLEQTAEFKTLLMLEAQFPEQDYYDLGGELGRLQIAGSYITLEGLQRLRASYTTLCEIKAYFDRLDAEAYPRLCTFAERLEIVPEIPAKIKTLLTQTGEIRDNASENLLHIRSTIRRKESETQRYIGKYLGIAKKEGWVGEDAEVSLRNERLVIPVAAAYKKSMRGFIHDVSATGQTVFMEPEEIFNLNNEIVELKNEEKREIIEILKAFSDFLRPWLEVLRNAYRFLVAVDFLRAKARLAIKLEAGLPVVENRPLFAWREARHPLLKLRAESEGRASAVVPLDLEMEGDERILIISGPNAGGKSVCLKTVGLLQYMLQCGLLVCMREDSTMGIFQDIFVDIGDEQSIENDLSTYSSHLKNMKFWVERAGRKTLFLSDELGGGTEPQVGGAIAESLVEHLLRKGAYGIVTTHYTNLKLLAKTHPGIVNGAMLFDRENLRPLYLLRKGLPGSSFAFEIARKIGLPEEVLSAASRKAGRRQMNFEQELQQIETEKHFLNKRKQEVQVADALLGETLEKYNRLLAELEENRLRLMREAKAEARELVRRANADIERTIREIREAAAEKRETQRLRKTLEEETARYTLDTSSDGTLPGHASAGARKKPRPDAGAGVGAVPPLREGSYVRLKNGGKNVARISAIKGGTAQVDFDYMRMRLPLADLIPLSEGESRRQEEQRMRASVKYGNLAEGKSEFRPRIDVRGERGEEAVEKVSKFLDDAVLYGEKHLEILHGKGNGILHNMIHALLSKHPCVSSFGDQEEQFGGAGVTVVEIL